MKREIVVKDMMCVKCEAKIRNNLADNGIECEINLKDKKVVVDEEVLSAAIDCIKELGYTPEV